MKIDVTKFLSGMKQDHSVILAGDIGGTKTTLGRFILADGILSSHQISHFSSADYPDFKSILTEFVRDHGNDFQSACIGIAGPVVNGICQTTNLPWVVDISTLKPILGIESVMLINDMEATAYGIRTLPDSAFVILNDGHSEPKGNIAVIAAGTGLGEGMLLWDGEGYRAVASEGGHADFAPGNTLELDFCRYLLDKFGHSSYERVLSGPGLLNIYDFLKQRNPKDEPSWLKEEMTQNDPSAVISQNALNGRNELCVKALDIFCAVYGAEAGNLALKILARGGVYLGGGIAPKILPKLQDGLFKKVFLDKGRLSHFLSQIPVYVILEEKTALYGAAMHALQTTAKALVNIDHH